MLLIEKWMDTLKSFLRVANIFVKYIREKLRIFQIFKAKLKIFLDRMNLFTVGWKEQLNNS